MNRQEAIKILKAAQTDKFPYDSGLLAEAMDMAISSLETDEAYQLEYEQPTITIPVEDYLKLLEGKQEPKTGHWIKGYTFPDGAYWKCDKCNELIKVKIPMRYCNNCGAKMVEPQESEDKE